MRAVVPQIQLTSWPSGFANIPLNSLVTNPSRSGAGAQVLNNFFFNNRGRGVSCQASGCLIAGNNIQHMGQYQAITAVPNGAYAESEFASNMVVGGQPVCPRLLSFRAALSARRAGACPEGCVPFPAGRCLQVGKPSTRLGSPGGICYFDVYFMRLHVYFEMVF